MNDLRQPEKKFRPEIEGIRTVATLLIAIYHIWLGRVSGGVDVFFVLSGFLITMSLLSRFERDGTIKYWDYLLGLARRLLAQGLFIIIIIGGLAIFFLPQVDWGNIVPHMIASSFFYENWRLAFDAVDYLAQGESVSPFQHYWSLGVQGQFYVMWPLLILFTFFLAKKVFKTPVRKTFLVALMLIIISSLSYSVYQTGKNQPWAYFDTFARMWEFSLGGLLAVLLPYLRLNKWVNTVIGWVGLALIMFTGILLPISTVFPGYLALIPVSGVLLIIIGSDHSTAFDVHRFLQLKPFIFSGNLTYAIYLWHWPILVFYQSYMNVEKVSILAGLGILVSTFVLSYLSTTFIEKPILKIDIRSKKKKVLSLLSAMFIVTASVMLFVSVYIEQIRAQDSVTELVEGGVTQDSFDINQVLKGEQMTLDYPGALSILDHIEAKEGLEPIPSLLTIKNDLPSFYEDAECLAKDLTEVIKCSYGVLDNPTYTLALVGGSHSGHWFPTLEILAEELDFQIDLYNHDGCRFTDNDEWNHLTENCIEWNANLLEHLKANPPDLVFTTATVNKREEIPSGFINQWKALEGLSTVFAIRDNPRMNEDAPSCLEKADNPLDCAVTREEGLPMKVQWEDVDDIPSNVVFGDLTDYFCDDEACYPLIGNVIVYRDNNHITAAYAKTLAPVLKEQLEAALK